MAFADLLIHRLDVHRRSGATDRFGQPVDQNPSQRGPVTGTFPCRLSSAKRGRTAEERSLDVFEVSARVFVLPDADVREDDTIAVVDPRTDFELLPAGKVMRKSYISDSAGVHHAELEVLVQRGPQ